MKRIRGVPGTPPPHEPVGTPTVQLEESSESLIRRLEAQALELEQTNRRLADREARLRTIVDTEPECVKLLAGDGSLLEMNPAGLRMIEADSLAQVQNRSIYPLIMAPHRAAFRALTRKVMRGESGILEFELIGLQGGHHWLETHASPLRDAAGAVTALLGVTRDITERKRADAALLERDQLLAESQRLAHLGSWSWELATNRILWSDETYRIYGVTAAAFDLVAESFLGLVHPDDRPAMQEWIRVCASGESPGELQFRCVHPDGTIHSLQGCGSLERAPDGTPMRMVGSVQDVTAQRRAEAALRTSEMRFRALFESAPDIVTMFDTEGRITAVNGAWTRQLGFAPEEVLGGLAFDFVASEEREESVRNWRRMVESGVETHRERTLRRKDGSTFVVDTSAVLVPATMDGSAAIIAIARDATERKRAEDELARANERLQALSHRLLASQETERRDLARELHDEIGQTLTALKIGLQVIERFPDPAALAGRLRDATAVVERALQQVRSLSLGLRPPLLDDLGVSAAIRWMVDEHARRAGLHVVLIGDAPTVRCDPTVEAACFRVAQEALTNIVKHAAAHEVTVELRQERGALHLYVQDDGTGFDVAAARGAAARGASLGLVGMEERATLAGGGIEWTSPPARGTTVHAWFALAGADAPERS